MKPLLQGSAQGTDVRLCRDLSSKFDSMYVVHSYVYNNWHPYHISSISDVLPFCLLHTPRITYGNSLLWQIRQNGDPGSYSRYHGYVKSKPLASDLVFYAEWSYLQYVPFLHTSHCLKVEDVAVRGVHVYVPSLLTTYLIPSIRMLASDYDCDMTPLVINARVSHLSSPSHRIAMCQSCQDLWYCKRDIWLRWATKFQPAPNVVCVYEEHSIEYYIIIKV